MTCDVIQRGDLDAYVSAELPRAEARRVEVHLFGCSECAIELRRLRAEQRLFRMRAEEDRAEVPSFEGVLARLGAEVDPGAPASDPPVPARVAKGPVRSGRVNGGARPSWAARLAPAGVAVAAIAAAAASWVGVRPPPVEPGPGGRTEAADMEILPDRVCTNEDASTSEPLASMPMTSMPPVRDARPEPAPRAPEEPGVCNMGARVAEICAPGDPLATDVCGEAVSWCGVGK